MQNDGNKNANVQPVQQRKVLDESSWAQLVTVEEGMEHVVADTWRFVHGAVEGGGVDGGVGGVGEREWGVVGALILPDQVSPVVDVGVRITVRNNYQRGRKF